MKGCPTIGIRNGPQPAAMRVNDCPADGKTHAQAFGLGTEKSVKDSVLDGIVQTDSTIPDFYLNQARIRVPRVDQPAQLQLSSLILADLVRPAKSGEFITDPFILGTVKVYPSARNEFVRGKPLGFYFEVYNVAADQQTLEPSLSVDLSISDDGKAIPLPFKNLERLLHRYADRFFAGSMLNTQPLEPGKYSLSISVTDHITGQNTVQTVEFRIL